MNAAHICHLILDSQQHNPIFHSPISENPKGIIDIGTGSGIWAKGMAERYTEAMVIGVDDVTKAWGCGGEGFELVHLR